MRADSAADGSLGDHLYFEKLVYDIVNIFWNFNLALLYNFDAC